jgi:hypothetical protein
MEQTQYLEITSGRRNRNLNPLPSNFEVPLSQSGQHDAYNSVDPVSLAAPQVQWNGNYFNAKGGAQLIVTVESASTTTTGIGNTSSSTTLIVNTTTGGDSGSGALQLLSNYYVGAVASLNSTTITDRIRITQYNYLGNDRGEFTLESYFSSTITPGTTVLYIVDPTDLDASNYQYPYFFIPNSIPAANSWVNFVLFNDTRNQSRRVSSFDKTTHLLGVDTSGSATSTGISGPISNWLVGDTYSLRRQIPNFYISALAGDTTNNPVTYRSFNLSINDADSVSNPQLLTAAFLQIESSPVSGTLTTGTSTTQVVLAGSSSTFNGYYNGYSIRMTSGSAAGEITKISSYVGSSQTATLSKGFTTSPGSSTYQLIPPYNSSRRIVKYVDYRSTATGGSTTTINFPISGSNQAVLINNYYTGLYIVAYISGTTYETRTISSYIITKDPTTGAVISAIATIDSSSTAFTAAVTAGTTFTITSGIVDGPFTYSLSTQSAYILQFSYDNLFPFINAQNQIGSSQQWYEIELLNLILPNQILDCGFGSLITFYQYLYVQLENTNGAGISGNNNIISNNSNAVSMTFRATIDDVPNPVNSTFIKIDGDGMTQIVRFDPQDNLKFAVYLGNSTNANQKELFKVLPPEYYSPLPPNPLIQISAMFSLKKVVMKQDVVAKKL